MMDQLTQIQNCLLQLQDQVKLILTNVCLSSKQEDYEGLQGMEQALIKCSNLFGKQVTLEKALLELDIIKRI